MGIVTRGKNMALHALPFVIALAILNPPDATAHGVWSHMHVTGWAIENLPPGEVKTFFSDPDVMNAALFATVFTDSGYGITDDTKNAARAFSEHSHWEPFVQKYIEWMVANDPPPWTTAESKRRVAFLMGCAAHGLQDEIFDSLLLDFSAIEEGGDQDGIDPATDGFLALDGHLRFFPTRYVPMDVVLELFSELNQDITEDVINGALDLITGVYVNDQLGPQIAKAIGEDAVETLPWLRAHYLDPDVPGSLHSEIEPTGRYMEAIWERLHQRFKPSDIVSHTLPAEPGRLVGTQAAHPESWFTVIYGIGVAADAVTTSWMSQSNLEITHALKGTRWNEHWTRLHRLQPKQDLISGEWYTITLGAEFPLISAQMSGPARTFTVQAPCASPDPVLCPELPKSTISLTGPVEADVAEPTQAEPTAVEPTAVESVQAEPMTAEPVAAEPNVAEPPEKPEVASPAESTGGCSSSPQGSPASWPIVALSLALGAWSTRRRNINVPK